MREQAPPRTSSPEAQVMGLPEAPWSEKLLGPGLKLSLPREPLER